MRRGQPTHYRPGFGRENILQAVANKLVEGASIGAWNSSVALELGQPRRSTAVERVTDLGLADASGLFQRAHGEMFCALFSRERLVFQTHQLQEQQYVLAFHD